MGRTAGRARYVWLALLVVAAALPGAVVAQEAAPDVGGKDRATFGSSLKDRGRDVVPGQLIVKYDEGVGADARAAVRSGEDLDRKKDLDLINADVVKVEGRSVEAAIEDLEDDPDVAYATPDRIVRPMGYADEERFGELWGLRNTGQEIEGRAGQPDSDVDAPEADALSTGGEGVTVAVIDDGVDFGHPDLAGHQWVNDGETPNNNIDDDRNGYIDDVNGFDFANDDNTVHDVAQDFHGTHVAGTIAASSDGENVVGVAPNVKIMAVKFLGGPFTSTSTAIEAIEYASDNGAKISNNSWGYVGPADPALRDAIEASDMLFVASAGNESINNDTGFDVGPFSVRAYPASYDLPNIISVAATNNTGRLARFSNYGRRSVDVSAPGVDVLSTVPSVPAESGAVLAAGEPPQEEWGPLAPREAFVAGFGVEEISGAEARADFMNRALRSVGYSTCVGQVCTTEERPIVLVDDDLSSEFGRQGIPDVTPTLRAAIDANTDAPVEVIEVGPGDGPGYERLRGKTVVWATGWAPFSADRRFTEIKKTLTFNDQNTLTRLLNGGGNVVLTGMDALYGIEDSAFVRDALGVEVRGDYYTGVFEGGPAFGDQSYALDDPKFSIPFYHDAVIPLADDTSTLGDVVTPVGYEEYFSGTSMSAPHTTGVAALAAGEYPGLLNRPGALKRLVMQTGEKAPLTRGQTVTGDLVNARKAVTNTAPTISNTSPTGTTSNDKPAIRATVLDLQGALSDDGATKLSDKGAVRLFVDGNRRFDSTYDGRSGALVLTDGPTKEGRHTVKVTATDPQGATASKSWSFRIG